MHDACGQIDPQPGQHERVVCTEPVRNPGDAIIHGDWPKHPAQPDAIDGDGVATAATFVGGPDAAAPRGQDVHCVRHLCGAK